MGAILSAAFAGQPLPRGPYPTAAEHYTEQATLAGSASHLAALIRRSTYTPADLALLVSVIANKAADMPSSGDAVQHLDGAADALEALS